MYVFEYSRGSDVNLMCTWFLVVKGGGGQQSVTTPTKDRLVPRGCVPFGCLNGVLIVVVKLEPCT